jgi:hypothetical protein
LLSRPILGENALRHKENRDSIAGVLRLATEVIMKSTNQLTENLNAGARVGALVLAVVAFAGIWENDAQHRDDQIAQRNRVSSPLGFVNVDRNQSHTSIVATKTVGRTILSVGQVTDRIVRPTRKSRPDRPLVLRDASSTAETEDDVSLNASSVWSNLTLPESIAAGSYRIVDTRGRVDFIRLGTGPSVGPNMYSVQSAGITTYFIRIEEPIIEAAVASPTRR